MEIPTPLYNVLLGIATLLYVDQAVAFVDSIQKRGRLTILQSRKIIHMVATSTVIGWAFFDHSHWTWRLASLIYGLYTIKLLAHGLALLPVDPEFYRTMTRTGSRLELCQGPLIFASIFFFICNFGYKKDLGTYFVAAMGIGDGLAPLFGNLLPWMPFRSLGGEPKTISGSFGMFMGTFSGIYFFSWLLGTPSHLEMTKAFAVSLSATVAEAAAGAWDNIAIPLSIYTYLNISGTFLEK